MVESGTQNSVSYIDYDNEYYLVLYDQSSFTPQLKDFDIRLSYTDQANPNMNQYMYLETFTVNFIADTPSSCSDTEFILPISLDPTYYVV